MDNTETAFWQRMQYAADYFTQAVQCFEGVKKDDAAWKPIRIEGTAFSILQAGVWIGMAYNVIPFNDHFRYLDFVKEAQLLIQKELAKMIQV